MGVGIEASTSLEYIPYSGSMKKHREKKRGEMLHPQCCNIVIDMGDA
jgi:hypothetical protein